MKEVTFEDVVRVSHEDLDNTDHVGFIDANKDKSYIVCYDNNSYGAISTATYNTCNEYFGNCQAANLPEVVNNLKRHNQITKMFVFDTRQELYQWLVEE